jgi:DNA-binding MarR family transcriptional regulator
MAEYVPYRPYKGTAGWSGTDTSKARALNNLLTGREYNNQQKALALLKDNPAGITWKELSEAANVHHGTASGVLSVLHKAGAILRSANVRNRCAIYYHLQYSDSIINQVYKKKEKLCPHCGNDINA